MWYSTTVLKECAQAVLGDLKHLDETLRSRLEWSDGELLRSAISFLDTQTWCRAKEDVIDEVKVALEYIISNFRLPLEVKHVQLAGIHDKVEEIVHYAKQYMNVEKQPYQKVWYKLHIAPDMQKWVNVLAICELLFSLPFSNGSVERMFSTLKVIEGHACRQRPCLIFLR